MCRANGVNDLVYVKGAQSNSENRRENPVPRRKPPYAGNKNNQVRKALRILPVVNGPDSEGEESGQNAGQSGIRSTSTSGGAGGGCTPSSLAARQFSQ